jgi:STE24 endopeptidase
MFVYDVQSEVIMKNHLLFAFFFFLIVQECYAVKSEIVPFNHEQAAAAAQIKDPSEATRAYLDAVPAERRQKTKAYARGKYFLNVGDFLFSSILMVLLISTGLSVRFRNSAERMTRFRWLQNWIYWIQFLIVTTLITFPLTIYSSYYREKKYDLLTQTFSAWLWDQTIGLLVGLILGGILIMILYGVLRRAQRTWWLWGSAVMILFLILTIAIAPVFIMPLFNKFTPIKDAILRESILTMAHQHGIPANEVYEMDASKRTDRISAFVNGMLGTMRIVMFDNTLKRCTPEEIQMIMGHEMGHYVLNHVWKTVTFFGVVIVIGFLFLRSAFARILIRWPNTGVQSVSDIAGLPLLIMLLGVFLFVTSPITNTYIRGNELDADNFGLDASKYPDAAATTFLKLGEYRDLVPHPMIEVLLYDHPSGYTRILNAMKWKQSHNQ